MAFGLLDFFCFNLHREGLTEDAKVHSIPRKCVFAAKLFRSDWPELLIFPVGWDWDWKVWAFKVLMFARSLVLWFSGSPGLCVSLSFSSCMWLLLLRRNIRGSGRLAGEVSSNLFQYSAWFLQSVWTPPWYIYVYILDFGMEHESICLVWCYLLCWNKVIGFGRLTIKGEKSKNIFSKAME